MRGKIYEKSIILMLVGSLVIGCAPKYTAHFQVKSHKMDHYVDDKEKANEDLLITSSEDVILNEDIALKEVVIDPEKIQSILDEKGNNTKIVEPKTQEELISTLKNDPEATVAIRFDELSKKEKKALKKEVRKQLKEHDKVLGMQQYNEEPNKLLYYILAVLIPPLAVGLWRGIGSDFWINILLTLLLIIPGIIHAIIVISSKPKTTGSAY